MADVVESMRKALAFLEGCDPLLRSGGQMNHELREEIRARLSQAGAGGGVVEAVEHVLMTHTGLHFATPADAARFKERLLAALAPSPSAGEPVAWVQPGYLSMLQKYGNCSMRAEPIEPLDYIVPLYATPPATPVQPTASVEAVTELIDSIAKCHSENAMDRAFLDNADEIAAAVLKLIADRDGEWACTVNRLEDEIAKIDAALSNPAPGHGEGGL